MSDPGSSASARRGGDVAAQFTALRDRLIGQDAFTLMASLLPMIDPAAAPAGDRSQTYSVPGENPLDTGNRLFSAIELACLDLMAAPSAGPSAICSVAVPTSSVPFSAYLFYKHAGGGGEGDDERADECGEGLTPEAMVRQARQMCETYGFREIKLKAGVLDPAVEVDTIKALHAAFGDAVPLRIDPNCAWSVPTSIDVGRALYRELGRGGYLEDPCAGMDGMAAVRKALLDAGEDTPLASNVAVTSFADLPAAVRRDAVQVVLCDPHYWGGVRQIQHLARLCQTFGLGLSMHSNSHLGVSLMAMTHAAAAAAPDVRLRHALSVAARGRRSRRRAHPLRRRLRRDPRSAGPRHRSRSGCPGARPRALRAVSMPQARRSGRDATARRSDLDAQAAPLVKTHMPTMTPSELRSRLTGVVGFPVTPFSDALTVDLAGLRANVAAMTAHPFCCIVAAGGTGELSP